MDEEENAKRRWVAPLAIGLVSFWLSAVFWSTSVIGKALVVTSVIFLGVAAYEGVKPLLRRRNPYDLDQLRRIHEEEELRAIDPGEVSQEAEWVVCPHCGNRYRTRLLICPNCKV
jgi:hypothetical protein